MTHSRRHNRRRFLVGLAGFLLLPSSASADGGEDRELEAVEAAPSQTFEYWIGSTLVTWNVIPSGRDPIGGTTYDRAKSTPAPRTGTRRRRLRTRFSDGRGSVCIR